MQATEALVDHFLTVSAIGAVYVSADGAIHVDHVVRTDCPGKAVFCCVRGRERELVDHARSLLSSSGENLTGTVAIREAAATLLIGLTPHEIVVSRARAAVAKVENTMTDMQKSGGLKAMNREFKVAREAGLASSYSAFIHAKKLALLDAMAGGR